MNAASKDIKDILKDVSSLGLTFAANLFVGKEPTTPNNCVTIFDTVGSPPMLTFDKTEKYDYPSIQIRVRDNSYIDGYDLALSIHDELHGRSHETVNGTYYDLIKANGSPALLDYDENDRSRFIINFNIQRR